MEMLIMAKVKLTEKSQEVFDCIKNAGGRISIPEIVEATGRAVRSVGANITDLQKKGLVARQKEEVGDETITYAILTPDGANFVPEAE